MLILDKIINESDTADIAADITQSLSNSYWQKLKNITTQLEQTLYNHITNKTYRFNTFILSRYINQTINTKLKINKNNSINILSLIGLNVFNAIRSDAKDLLPATYDIGAIDNLTITPTLFIMQDKNTFISPQASLFYTMVLKTSSNYFYINASSKTIDELGEIKNFIFYDLNKYNDYMEETKWNQQKQYIKH